jgi:hypothetical protein
VGPFTEQVQIKIGNDLPVAIRIGGLANTVTFVDPQAVLELVRLPILGDGCLEQSFAPDARHWHHLIRRDQVDARRGRLERAYDHRRSTIRRAAVRPEERKGILERPAGKRVERAILWS